MKTNCWLILGLMLSANLPGQEAKPPPAAASAQAPIVLVPGPATVTGDNVNVRGQARLRSEIVIRLKAGDKVTVIEQVILEKPQAGEPAQWAKIAYPSGANAWVHANYIDATNNVVLPPRLNLRTGPGENYSVVGLIERGTAVKEVSRKGNWIEIEPPSAAFAYVAAQFLKQEAAPPAVPPVVSVAPEPVESKPVPATVPEPEPVAAPPATTPAVTAAPAPAPAPAPPPPEPEPETEPVPPPVEEEPPPKRIVTHEGVVRRTTSIQAPTSFALVSGETGRTVNYLYTSSTNLDLSRYRGLRIVVTGEEGLDRRWTNTPIITIQRILVVGQE